MNKIAEFTYYGANESENSLIEFYQNSNGMHVCRVESFPHLTIVHPSYERVKAAFESWWEKAQKDWGASDVIWF